MTKLNVMTPIAYAGERYSVIVDGHGFYGMLRAVGWHVDFKRVLDLGRPGRRIEALYFTPLDEENADEHNPVIPLIDFLGYNGWGITTKDFTNDSRLQSGRRRPSLVPEMSVALCRAADYVDRFILFSGDPELEPAINYVQARGKPVTIVGAVEQGLVADGLRRAAFDVRELNSPAMRHFLEKTRPAPDGASIPLVSSA